MAKKDPVNRPRGQRKLHDGDLLSWEQSAVTGRTLRALRLRAGFTQRDIALAAGWSGAATVSRREAGLARFREAELGRIAAFFSIPAEKLLTGNCPHCEGNPPRGFTCQVCGADRPARARKGESNEES